MDPALQTMISNMPTKTGKSLDEWKAILAETKFDKHSHAVKFLKENHGLTHGFANTIVHLFKEKPGEEEDLVTNQYKGKEQLFPIFQVLEKEIGGFGKDIEFAPKKAYVSLRRKKQFGLIQPSTKTRLDLGLNLKGKEAEGRLEVSGSFNSMCTHRVRLQSMDEVDSEVISWLKEAYNAAQ